MAMTHAYKPEHDGPRWTARNVIALLLKLAKAAKDERGNPIIDGRELLEIWDENRVRLLLDHEVNFSIECVGGECQGCASGDAVESLDDALAAGWRDIEPAPKDCATSHFFGVCPACVAAEAAELSESPS